MPDTLSTSCRVGPRDLGTWLVENGWARPADDRLTAQAKLAEAQGRGIFGKGPEALPAEASAPVNEAPPAMPADGPAAISILPDAEATGATEPGLSGAMPVPGVGPEASDPLPPPATPLP